MIPFDITSADLRKLNSATQYPSIPTHHALGERGVLTESGNPFAGHREVYASEKIDGTNGRVIRYGDDWLIGSRNELLTARGDRMPNPTLGIVEAMVPYVPTLWGGLDDATIYVYFAEVYGHRATPAWKTYGDGQVAGVRLFDAAVVPVEVLEWPIERIASWRDGGGQGFLDVPQLQAIGAPMPLAPNRGVLAGDDIPADIEGMRRLLDFLAPRTRAEIGDAGVVNPGRPEGIVFRTADRSVITKARFEDYDRTLRKRGVHSGG